MKFALATIAPLVTSDATLNLSVSSNNLPILARSARNVGTKRSVLFLVKTFPL